MESKEEKHDKDLPKILLKCNHYMDYGVKECSICNNIKHPFDLKVDKGFTQKDKEVLTISKFINSFKNCKCDLKEDKVENKLNIEVKDKVKGLLFNLDNQQMKSILDSIKIYNVNDLVYLDKQKKSVLKFILDEDYRKKYYNTITKTLKMSTSEKVKRFITNNSKKISGIVGVVVMILFTLGKSVSNVI